MKLRFWKKDKTSSGMSEAVLWQLSPLRKLIGNQPQAWNNRLGKQHNLRKHMSKLWKLNQVSLW